jgi:hypothetical protein
MHMLPLLSPSLPRTRTIFLTIHRTKVLYIKNPLHMTISIRQRLSRVCHPQIRHGNTYAPSVGIGSQNRAHWEQALSTFLYAIMLMIGFRIIYSHTRVNVVRTVLTFLVCLICLIFLHQHSHAHIRAVADVLAWRAICSAICAHTHLRALFKWIWLTMEIEILRQVGRHNRQVVADPVVAGLAAKDPVEVVLLVMIYGRAVVDMQQILNLVDLLSYYLVHLMLINWFYTRIIILFTITLHSPIDRRTCIVLAHSFSFMTWGRCMCTP